MTVTEYEYSNNHSKSSIKSCKDHNKEISFALKLLFFVLTLVLSVQSVMLRIELNRQNDENVRLEYETQALKEENTRLLINYGFNTDLEELETLAVEKLGMIRPQAYQIIRIKDTANR